MPRLKNPLTALVFGAAAAFAPAPAALVAAGSAVLFAAGPAGAQGGMPTPLVPLSPPHRTSPRPAPRESTPPESAPRESTPPAGEKQPPAAAPPAASPPPAPAPRAEPRGIEVESLGRANVEGMGTLDDDHGGLGADLWRGMSRAMVTSDLTRLPTRYRSATLRDLARRLLLTQAEAPRGLIAGRSLLSLRLEKLYRMGEVEGAAALVRALPTRLTGEHIGVYRADILLLKGETEAACDVVTRNLLSHDTIPYQQLNAACLALAKKPDQAALALNLLREREAIPGESWERLIEAVSRGDRIVLRSLKKATPMHLALATAAKATLPEDAAETDDLAVLRMIALNTSAPEALRLEAAEKAARWGALSAGELAAVYEAQSIGKGELAAAAALARRKFDARARARLYKAAKTEANPAKRLALAARFWGRAGKRWDMGLAARLTAPLIADVTPEPRLRRHAGGAALALFQAGDAQRGAAWYKLLETGDRSEPASVLWPVARLAAPSAVLWDAARLQSWALMERRDAPKAADRRIAILRVLFEAVGDDGTKAPNWAALLPAPTAGQRNAVIPRLWRGMRGASVMRWRGGAVVGALGGIEDGDLAKLDDVDLDLVLTSLKAVGLEREVRALAVEAAVLNGL